MSDLRTQQGINKRLRFIQDIVVNDWIIRLWTKHRLVAVRCVYGRTPPTGVTPDVDAIPSIVMWLISHARPYCTTNSPSGHRHTVDLHLQRLISSGDVHYGACHHPTTSRMDTLSRVRYAIFILAKFTDCPQRTPPAIDRRLNTATLTPAWAFSACRCVASMLWRACSTRQRSTGAWRVM